MGLLAVAYAKGFESMCCTWSVPWWDQEGHDGGRGHHRGLSENSDPEGVQEVTEPYRLSYAVHSAVQCCPYFLICASTGSEKVPIDGMAGSVVCRGRVSGCCATDPPIATFRAE